MGTTGNVEFFGLELSIDSDAYPETVIPDLSSLRKEVFETKRSHGLSISQAVAVILSNLGVDNTQEKCWLRRGSYSYPRFEYKVDELYIIEVDIDEQK